MSSDAASGIPGLPTPAGSRGSGHRTARHTLVVPAVVTPERVWELLSQLFPAAERGSEITDLTPGAQLSGPHARSDASIDWHADVTRVRADVVDQQESLVDLAPQDTDWAEASDDVTDPDGLGAAFPDGDPMGVEHEVIAALVAIARRTGGSVRLDEGGGDLVVTPTPQVMVDVSVYWTGEPFSAEELRAVVAKEGHDESAHIPDEEPNDDDAPPPGWAMVAVSLAGEREVVLETRVVEQHDPVPTVILDRLGRDSLACCDIAFVPDWDGGTREQWLAECDRGHAHVGPIAFAVTEAVDGLVVDGDDLLVDRYSLLGGSPG